MRLGVSDLLDQARPEIVPDEVAIVVHRHRHAENPRFPGSFELQLTVLAGDGQIVTQTFDPRIAWGVGLHGPYPIDSTGRTGVVDTRATPIIASRLTSAASSASLIPSVPAGRSGSTIYRSSALLSQT